MTEIGAKKEVEIPETTPQKVEKPKQRRGPRLPKGPKEEPLEEDEYNFEEIPLKRQWPTVPGANPTFEQMEQYMQKLEQEQWDSAKIYVWRSMPAILREPKYIEVITEKEEFTKEALIRKHGGGKYKIAVRNNEILAGKGKIVMTAQLNVPMSEYDPILDYDELDLGNPANRSYVDNLVARGILDRGGNVVNNRSSDENLTGLVRELVGQMASMSRQQVENARNAAKGTDPEGIAMSKALDIMGNASQRSNDMLLEQAKGQDPKIVLDMITKIADKFMQHPQGTNDGVLVQMMKMQADQAAASQQMLLKMMEIQNAKTDSATAEDKALDRMVKYKELFGGIGDVASGRTPWYEKALEVAPTIIGHIGNAIQNVTQLQAMKQGIKLQNPPSPPQGGMMVKREEESSEEEGNEMINAKQIVQQYGQLIIIKLNDGVSGFDFADNLVAMYGMQVHSMVTSVGKEALLQAMKDTTEFYSATQYMWEDVEKFVDEFFRYREILAEEQAKETPIGSKEGELQ